MTEEAPSSNAVQNDDLRKKPPHFTMSIILSGKQAFFSY